MTTTERDGFAGTLVRPDDQVRLTFELINGTVDRATNRIERLMEYEGIFYLVGFGAQHTVERTVAAAELPPDKPLAHRRALPSRLCFEIPPGTEFTVGNLLALARYALHVDPRADGHDGHPRAEPAGDVTAIEVPATLIVSPPGKEPGAGRFRAATRPLTRGDVTELWRAHLESTDGSLPQLRAIAHRPDDAGFPGYTRDLGSLVDQTCGADGVPLTAAELTLSSQGATIDVSGIWADGLVEAYRHRAITGRDLRVEVVTRGFLAPFGHGATLTTVAERDFRDDAAGDLTAALVEDTYLAITEPVVSYTADFTALMPHDGRGLPFTAVAAVDRGRGPVARAEVVPPNDAPIRVDRACLLTRGGDDLAIAYTATDRAGTGAIAFELPAVLVADRFAFEPGDGVGGRSVLGRLRRWYAQVAGESRRDLHLGGQAVAWADPTPRGPAGAVQTTNRIRLAFERPALEGRDPATVGAALERLGRPAFYPTVERAWVVDTTSATAFGSGTAFGGEPPETEVTVAQRWLDHGTAAANVDLGYLDLAVAQLVAPTAEAHGVLGAALNVGTFGQFTGPGVRFPDLGGWEWNPLTALGDIAGELPKLLGSLSLADLIPPIDIASLAAPDGLPAVSVEPRFDDPDLPHVPTGVCVHFAWEPPVRSFPPGGQPTFVADATTTARLTSTACAPPVHTTFTAALERFTLQLPPLVPVVAIDFATVAYHNDNGSASVETDIADFRFVGALGWLEPLKRYLTGLLDNGAPTFAEGIFVDCGLTIPQLSLGVLGVSGIRAELGLDLPDTGASGIELAVGRRANPFRITLLGFGGDGSFGLAVDARQIVRVEGSLAVTFELGVDVFVASASLSVSLGAYVEYESGEVTLGAFARLRGSLSVIGLLKVSGAVTVALEYKVQRRLLRGVAAVTGEVSCIFGSKEVTHDVTVEVALGTASSSAIAAGIQPFGDAAALSFGDRFTPAQWDNYCAAFAAA